jgi:hypothetical protein
VDVLLRSVSEEELRNLGAGLLGGVLLVELVEELVEEEEARKLELEEARISFLSVAVSSAGDEDADDEARIEALEEGLDRLFFSGVVSGVDDLDARKEELEDALARLFLSVVSGVFNEAEEDLTEVAGLLLGDLASDGRGEDELSERSDEESFIDFKDRSLESLDRLMDDDDDDSDETVEDVSSSMVVSSMVSNCSSSSSWKDKLGCS